MALNSMTGYGSALIKVNNINYLCEIKSLNSKYLDIFIKIPPKFQFLEPKILKQIQRCFHRGKVDVFFEIQESDILLTNTFINENFLEDYLKTISKLYNVVKQNRLYSKIFNPYISIHDIIELQELYFKKNYFTNLKDKKSKIKNDEKAILKALNCAIIGICNYKKKEGKKIKKFLCSHISKLSQQRKKILNIAPKLQNEAQKTYIQRINQLLKNIDKDLNLNKDKIYTEISALLAKMDITEELSRLEFHENAFLQTIKNNKTKPIGKKLDFICQEMFREVNTLSNKFGHPKVSEITVAIKQIIEEIRQQVQNIE